MLWHVAYVLMLNFSTPALVVIVTFSTLASPVLAFWGGPAVKGDQNVRLMVDCEYLVKRGLKNPASYKRVEVVTQGNKAAMTYTATNSFGGVITEKALCVDGKQVFPVR